MLQTDPAHKLGDLVFGQLIEYTVTHLVFVQLQTISWAVFGNRLLLFELGFENLQIVVDELFAVIEVHGVFRGVIPIHGLILQFDLIDPIIDLFEPPFIDFIALLFLLFEAFLLILLLLVSSEGIPISIMLGISPLVGLFP